MQHNIIYKVVNTITDDVYIGATTKSIEERKADHLQKSQKKVGSCFHESIATYGADAFKWEQIDSANSTNELAEKERQYILQYNSKEQGYNSDSGGGFKKIVYQFNEAGVLINSFSSLKEIETTLNYDKRRVSNACTTATLWKGSYWSYSLNNTFKKATDIRKKKVLQLSIDGKIIAKYLSVAEASRETGLSKTCISRCCRNEREQSGGFIWNYS
jgi:group I intron endonuclease